MKRKVNRAIVRDIEARKASCERGHNEGVEREIVTLKERFGRPKPSNKKVASLMVLAGALLAATREE